MPMRIDTFAAMHKWDLNIFVMTYGQATLGVAVAIDYLGGVNRRGIFVEMLRPTCYSFVWQQFILRKT